MGISKARLERYKATLWAICVSPEVGMYRIGYTKRAISKRADQYHQTKWRHLVMLADRLRRDDALELEKALQEYAWADGRKALYQKYDPDCRDGKHRRSSGGVCDGQEDETIHGVYMAWDDFR